MPTSASHLVKISHQSSKCQRLSSRATNFRSTFLRWRRITIPTWRRLMYTVQSNSMTAMMVSTMYRSSFTVISVFTLITMNIPRKDEGKLFVSLGQKWRFEAVKEEERTLIIYPFVKISHQSSNCTQAYHILLKSDISHLNIHKSM